MAAAAGSGAAAPNATTDPTQTLLRQVVGGIAGASGLAVMPMGSIMYPNAAPPPTEASEFAMKTMTISEATKTAVDVIQKVGFSSKSSAVQGTLPAVGWVDCAVSLSWLRTWYVSLNGAKTAFLKVAKELKEQIVGEDNIAYMNKLIEVLNDPESLQAEGCRINIQYKNKKGMIMSFYAIMCPSVLTNGFPAFLFGWAEIEVKGTKATEYMIIGHSKSNYFKSRTWYELVPLPANNKGITASDVNDLVGMIAPLIHLRFQDIAAPLALQK